MKNYDNLLQDLLFGAKDLISKANSVSDQFDMSIRLAEQVIKAMKLNSAEVKVVQQVVEEPQEEMVVNHKAINLVMNKEQYEELLGYPISDAAYDEYRDHQERIATGEDLNLWLPDPDGIQPIPEGAIVSLAVQENPMYKHLFEEQEEETIEREEQVEEVVVVEEPEPEVNAEEVQDIPMPTDVTAEIAGGEVVDVDNMTEEEVIAQALSEDDGVEIDIESDPVPSQVIVEIDGEDMDITEQFNLIKSLNKELSYDETVERASDWVEFGINKETFDILSFIENKDAEVIQCKTYLAYYIDAMEMDSIVYYINYFASNIEEDEEGNEVYVNDELQLEFLNEDNLSAFLEYVQQLQ